MVGFRTKNFRMGKCHKGITMKKVVILRGISGSGKSTYGKTHYPDAVVCSADAHRMQKVTNPDGTTSRVYRFDASMVGADHSNCLNDFIVEIERGSPLIVVDNTNIRLWEIQNYVKLARIFGYVIEIVEMTLYFNDDAKLCAQRNIHEVPEETVLSMAALFEPMHADDLPPGSSVRVEYAFSTKPGYISVSGQK